MISRKKFNGYSVKKVLIGWLLFNITLTVQADDLLDIYRLALENDPVLKQAYYSQNAIQELDDQGIAKLLPTVSFNAGTSKEYLFNKKRTTYQGGGGQDYWTHSFGLNLKQPLVHYDYWMQLSQSENQIAQAVANYEAEQQNLAFRVVDAYFKVLSAQDSYHFSQAEKQAISRQLEQAKQKYKVGLSAITDIHEAKAIYDRSLADEIAAKNQLEDEKQRLVEIIGNLDVNIKALDKQSDLELVEPDPIDITVWEKTADSNNLSIVALSNQVEISRKAIEVQKSGHLPQVDLIASFNQQDSDSTFGLRGDTEEIGLQLNIPLYAGGLVSSKVRQANFDYEAAKEKLVAERRSVHREVNTAYRGVLSSISKADALRTAVESAESALEATEAGLNVGTRTIVEVLIEQRNLFRAKRDHSQSIYDYIINRVKLKHAVSDISKKDLELINQLLTVNPE